MNQEYFASETQSNPDEIFFSSQHSPKQPDPEVYFGGATIRLKKKHPKSLWEDRAAEACRILSCLGDDEPEAVLEKIGEILETDFGGNPMSNGGRNQLPGHQVRLL